MAQGLQHTGSNGLFNDGLTNDGTCSNNGETQCRRLSRLGLSLQMTKTHAAYTIMDDIIANTNIIINGLEALGKHARMLPSTNAVWINKRSKGFHMASFLSISGEDKGTTYSDFVKRRIQCWTTLWRLSPGRSYTNLWYASSEGGAATSFTQGSALGALVAAAEQSC
ncbi:hypothetical protein BT96DRAFT_1000100 [Gymnopus androsaceus JB14]|uniref:Uncharacterized protein n=1 Tax=Gymnopus androsaceus JB14 TaxID=1447944 RepID=A0A6A4H6D8_9AGAR|nr:hypothetical protein BT96DRAFT_1000100 [Gymnopus androsaceus JB14]